MVFNNFFSERLEPITFDQPRRSWAVCIAITSLLAAWWVGRGQIGIASLSFSYSHQVLLFFNGQGWQSYLHWPPGYALLAVPVKLLGFSPLRSLWVVSWLSFAVSSVCIFLLISQWTDARKALMAALLFLMNPTMLLWANQAMTEMLFIAATLLSFYVLSVVFFLKPVPTNKYLPLLAGIAFSLPYWMRYIGLLTTASAVLVMVFVFFFRKTQRRAAAICIVTAFFSVLPLLLRNFLLKNNLTGHGLGNQPRSDFLSALHDTLRLLLQGWLPFPGGFKWLYDSDAILAVFFVLLMLLSFLHWQRFYLLLLAGFPFAYILAFSYAYSHTRIDLLNERFVIPGMAFLSMTLVLAWHEIEKRYPLKAGVKKICWIAFSILFLYVFVGAAMTGLRGAPHLQDRLSQQTIDYILHHVPKGSKCAGNRNQIQSFSLDYSFYQIPGNRPEDADYVRAHHAVWTRSSALRFWLENDIRYVLIFAGQKKSDPLLRARAYGGYVDSLQTVSLPEIAAKVELADGMVLQLADAKILSACLLQPD